MVTATTPRRSARSSSACAGLVEKSRSVTTTSSICGGRIASIVKSTVLTSWYGPVFAGTGSSGVPTGPSAASDPEAPHPTSSEAANEAARNEAGRAVRMSGSTASELPSGPTADPPRSRAVIPAATSRAMGLAPPTAHGPSRRVEQPARTAPAAHGRLRSPDPARGARWLRIRGCGQRLVRRPQPLAQLAERVPGGDDLRDLRRRGAAQAVDLRAVLPPLGHRAIEDLADALVQRVARVRDELGQ